MTARARDPQGVSLPAARLEAIRERLAKATRGPLVWTATDEKGNGWMLGQAWDKQEHPLGPGHITFEQWREDAQEYIEVVGRCAPIMQDEGATCNYGDPEFFAHAWEDIAWLLARLAPATPHDPDCVSRSTGSAIGCDCGADVSPATPSGAATAAHPPADADTREERTP